MAPLVNQEEMRERERERERESLEPMQIKSCPRERGYLGLIFTPHIKSLAANYKVGSTRGSFVLMAYERAAFEDRGHDADAFDNRIIVNE